MSANAVANSTHSPPPLALKRLTIFNTAEHALSWGLNTALGLYQGAKSYAPGFVVAQVGKIEDAATQRLAPVVARAQDITHMLLHALDDEADYFMAHVDSALAKTKQGVDGMKAQAINAKETGARTVLVYTKAYLAAVLAASKDIAEKLHAVSGVQAAQAKLQQAVITAQECTDPDVAIAMASDAWARFASYPPVSRLLAAAEPLSSRGVSIFNAFHDWLVGSPTYAFAVDTTGKLLAFATSVASGTLPYRLGAKYVYPKVEPVVEKIAHSKTVNKTVSYWKPAVM